MANAWTQYFTSIAAEKRNKKKRKRTCRVTEVTGILRGEHFPKGRKDVEATQTVFGFYQALLYVN